MSLARNMTERGGTESDVVVMAAYLGLQSTLRLGLRCRSSSRLVVPNRDPESGKKCQDSTITDSAGYKIEGSDILKHKLHGHWALANQQIAVYCRLVA